MHLAHHNINYSILPNYSRELEVARQVACEMGRVQLTHFRSPLKVIRKAPREFVSNVDMECHALANEMLSASFPYPILSEETRVGSAIDDAPTWVIDPIDGTHNFIAGHMQFGISIALIHNRQFALGVMYLPCFNEMYFAVKGQGAFMNDAPIYSSNNVRLDKSIIAYDNQFHLDQDSFLRYKMLSEASFTTRIFGSAVFDFCAVASGRLDARIWNKAKIFDFAAGTLIVIEAGGAVTTFDGAELPLDSTNIIASNGAVHDTIRALLQGAV